MKLLILALATFAVASSALLGGRSVNVLDDGTIVVRTDMGKQIIISKKMGPLGKPLTEIDITGPFTIGKKIQVDENNMVRVTPGTGTLEMNTMDMTPMDMMDRLKRSPKVSTTTSKPDPMEEIQKEFQGIVNQAGFDKLLAKVQKSVTKGKLDSTVVDYLNSLAEEMPWYTAPTTQATTSGKVVPSTTLQTSPTAGPLPWYMCNDFTCFKQMMMWNGIYQKPMTTYDQYMKMKMMNTMRMNPWISAQYPGYMGYNQGYSLNEGPYDSDPVARKNFWTTYMNRLNMNTFGSQLDDQQMPVNQDTTNSKLYY